MAYVDGFVLPMPKKNLAAYRRIARRAAKLWREHGALEVRECAGEDLTARGCLPFPRLMKVRRGETVVFSWIVFRSRAHRDRVNARVLQDPRTAKMMGHDAMPFDPKRMAYGGFQAIVTL